MQTYNIAEMATKKSTLFPVINESPGFNYSYRALLRKLLTEIGKVTNNVIIASYRQRIIQSPNDHLTVDVDQSQFAQLDQIVLGLNRSIQSNIQSLIDLESIRHTQKFARAAKNSLGIDISGIIRKEDLADYVDAAALANASLVKGMSDDLTKRVKVLTMNALTEGKSVRKLQSEIKHALGVMDSRARLIARDQTSKINADMNERRHRQAGMKEYIWRTSQDERVRPLHKGLDGRQYDYSKPTGAENGLSPGKPIQCRCIAQAIVSEESKTGSVTPTTITKPKPEPEPKLTEVEVSNEINKLAAKFEDKNDFNNRRSFIKKAIKDGDTAALKDIDKIAELSNKEHRARLVKSTPKASKPSRVGKPYKPTYNPGNVNIDPKEAYQETDDVQYEKIFHTHKKMPQYLHQHDDPHLKSYVANGYIDINKALRNDPNATSPAISALKGLMQTTKKDHTLYRGIAHADEVIGDLVEGQTFEGTGFMSWSRNPSISKSFVNFSEHKNDNVGYLFKLTFKRNQDRAIITNAGEAEFILDHGTKFVVKSVTDADKSYGKVKKIIEVEIL